MLTGGALPGHLGECHRQRALRCHRGLSLRAFCFHRLTYPHNMAVTFYLLGAMCASPDLHDADTPLCVSNFHCFLLLSFNVTVTYNLFIPLSFNCFPAACKTYYKTVYAGASGTNNQILHRRRKL